MKIFATRNVPIYHKKQNNINKNFADVQDSKTNNSMLNVVHYPVFFGKSNLITNQSPKLTIKNVRAMFQNDELPESSLTKVVWERSNLDDTKAPEYDLKLNQESYKIFAEIIGEYEGELNLNADSNIPGMKNKDLLMSFIKIIQEKGSSDFYKDLSKNNKPLFNHMIKSILSITPDELTTIMNYKRSSWPMGKCISSCNVAYIKGELESNSPRAMDFVNYASTPNAKSSFNDVNVLTNAIEQSQIDEQFILYRGDQFDGILNLIYDSEGNICRLGSEIEGFIKNNPNATETEISNFALKTLKGKKFTKDRFMSMTANKELACKWATSNVIGYNNSNPNGCVVFEETIPKGNGLIFMEPYTPMKKNYDDQFEFVGQRGDNHVVTSAHFDKDKRILFVKTQLEHNTPKPLYPVNFPTINKETATPIDVINAIEENQYEYLWT